MTLELKNLGRCVRKNWIIRDLNLKVEHGECLAILGPSGCGKSSTLRLIAGLDRPDEGKVFINNVDVTDISPVKRNVGMVFQSYALFPHLSVCSNLSLGLKVRGIGIKEQNIRVSKILSLMQLEHLAKRIPAELSGGQRQRVALARALLREPDVYLLDEPMSNLDAQLREELRPEIRRLILNGESPVLYVTHDQQEAMAMANRVAVMKNGKLEQIATPQELYRNPNSIFVASFIGRPQINILPTIDGVATGIRPEHIKIVNDGIKCRVIHKEWLGTNQLLYLESTLGTLRMTCDAGREITEEININWDKKDEHSFDKSTGHTLNIN